MFAGAYVHIPFCQSRCSYCHFTTRPWQAAAAQRYFRAAVREIEAGTPWDSPVSGMATVYFGGGTPSMVPELHIAGLIGALRMRFGVLADAEVTVEANPGTLSELKIECYRKHGVSRVSMGAQSFDNSLLRFLGRSHTSDEIVGSVRLLQARGVENINLDLMLGLPGQTRETWNEDLDRLCGTCVPHVSVYMLDLDVQSPLRRAIDNGLYQVPDDDLVSDLYLETIDRLDDAGYRHYEISNFARPGFECRHNLRYWRQEPVLGFGASSHSHDGGSRWANISNPAAYMTAVERGTSPVEWRECQSPARRLEEAVFLGLRLVEGIDWQKLLACFGSDAVAAARDKVAPMIESGLLEESGSSLRLTRRGILLSNEVFQRFV